MSYGDEYGNKRKAPVMTMKNAHTSLSSLFKYMLCATALFSFLFLAGCGDTEEPIATGEPQAVEAGDAMSTPTETETDSGESELTVEEEVVVERTPLGEIIGLTFPFDNPAFNECLVTAIATANDMTPEELLYDSLNSDIGESILDSTSDDVGSECVLKLSPEELEAVLVMDQEDIEGHSKLREYTDYSSEELDALV